MKKIIMLLMVALMSVNLSASAATKASKTENSSIVIPANLIVHQTVTLKDGTMLDLYYSKQGSKCCLYSTNNLDKLNPAETVGKVKKTEFELVSEVKGKCYYETTESNLWKLARSVYNKYVREK